jgi:hypothetical protein
MKKVIKIITKLIKKWNYFIEVFANAELEIHNLMGSVRIV